MSKRVVASILVGLFFFVLSIIGVVAIINWVTGSRDTPVVAQQPSVVPPADTPTRPPVAQASNTPPPAPAYVPCGDGTFALSQADCAQAKEQPVNNGQSESPTSAPAATTADVPESTGNGCTATGDNARGSSAQLTVTAGHLLSVQWYYEGQAQQQSVLEAGVYQSKPNVKVGAYWDYPDCPFATVEAEAVGSTGSTTAGSAGFEKIG